MYGMGVWGFCETWKELDKVISRFCKKLMGIPSFAANAFTEIETARESSGSKYVRQIVKFWYRITCLDINDTAKECYKWQRSNTSV
jgi:hypothetical protein